MGSFSVRLKCRFSAPACMISPRRAERRSRLAKGHRRRRREAVWTAASTARRLIRSGLPPRHYPFRGVLVAETSAFENLVSHPAKDLTAGRKSNAPLKLTPEVLEFVASADRTLSGAQLSLEVEARFGVRLHRRTIERARR
jgi:hypothetical protein